MMAWWLRRELLGQALAVLVPFSVYVYTLAPTVSFGGDCGDFITASHLLALAHPSGYPLFLLSGKLFSLLPLGDVAFRMNLLSATFAAAACGCAYACVHALTGSMMAALACAWGWGFSYVFWSQAVITEVYTANVFFILLTLALLARFIKDGDRRLLYGMGLALGLGAGNHLSLVLLLPAFLAGGLMAWWQRTPPPQLRAHRLLHELAIVCVFFLLPFVLYAYVPLRAAHSTHKFWDDGARWLDPAKSFEGFKFYVTGQMYRPHMFAIPLSEVPARFQEWLMLALAQLLFLFPLAFVGLIWGLRRQRAFAIAVLGAIALNLWFYLRYEVSDIANFYLPSWAALAVAGGVGAGLLLQSAHHSLFRPVLSGFLLSSVLCAFLLAFPQANMRGKWDAYRMARQVLAETPPNSVILVRSDELLFSLWYFKNVHGGAKQQIEAFPEEEKVWMKHLLLKLPDWAKRHRVFATFHSPLFQKLGFHLHPKRFVAELRRSPPVKVLPMLRHGSAQDQPAPPASQGQELAPGVRLLKASLHVKRIRPEMFLGVTVRWQVAKLKEKPPLVWLCQKKGNPKVFEAGPVGKGKFAKQRWWVFSSSLDFRGKDVGKGGGVLEVGYCVPVIEQPVEGRYELRIAPGRIREKLSPDQARALLRRSVKVGEFEVFFR